MCQSRWRERERKRRSNKVEEEREGEGEIKRRGKERRIYCSQLRDVALLLRTLEPLIQYNLGEAPLISCDIIKAQ